MGRLRIMNACGSRQAMVASKFSEYAIECKLFGATLAQLAPSSSTRGVWLALDKGMQEHMELQLVVRSGQRIGDY